ncbi:MAG: hypothetical protein E6Q34_09920, partial [Burkholderiaceae bacterium]
MPPTIVVFPVAEWGKHASALIRNEIRKLSVGGKSTSVMLTGGRSAQALYAAWAKSPDFLAIGDVDYFLGDERCVPADHEESNSGMVMRDLFGG